MFQLEAGVVDGATGKYGAVANTRLIKNPIYAADLLLRKGPHPMLVGPAADAMAKKEGLVTVQNNYFTTEARLSHLKSSMAAGDDGDLSLGTVGAVVLDSQGRLAAAGSTGGTTGKMPGRIGDTAILGAGLYANSDIATVL